ncbi:MAG: serine/threonine protein kinase, partial [Lachnospiraceae bacterium]|nr:serine/threonine protein kinase [Lachnospiraceae bacterium]
MLAEKNRRDNKTEYVLPEDCGYRIVRRLGSGGEGTVYLVCYMNTEQLRAAKILKNVRKDQRHELNMMKNLNHPSLPRIIDVLEQDGYLWLIMDYIYGQPLDHIAAEGMTEPQIWSVARQLSQVLIYLHTRKEPILHLDVKPTNILIRPDDSLVLIDFGTSIRGHPDSKDYCGYGTRGFAAPEQFISGCSIDARADIYGVGAVLYYCCYGKAPLKQKTGKSRKAYGRQLKRVIKRCLAESPEKRFRDSRELYKEICCAEEKTKKASGQLLKCIAIIVLTVFIFISLGAAQKEEQEYRRLLDMARSLGFSQAIACYEKASSLFPADGDWYLQLVEQITADGLFEQEEEEGLKELIYEIQPGSGCTLLELLKENTEAYSLVTYRIGLAYWYFYNGTGGKSAAAWWLEQAVSSQEEPSEEWFTAAAVLSRISSYYGMLESTGSEAQREEKEWNYW